MSLNVAILGHVDSGKTTLTRALAEIASTAAFDKHAEQGGRQNTIDLGFSSLTIADHRIALIDCPGHATLVRAVLVASQVMDMAIIVVDAVAGVQPQTAEHLLLCSLLCREHIVIALTKTDLIPSAEISKVERAVRKALKAVSLSENIPIVPLALIPGQSDVKPLLNVLEQMVFIPRRPDLSELLFAVDHCFPLKGKGTVLTGTVLQGILKLNQEIEIPFMKEKRKIKGLESWKQQVPQVSAGERAAVLVQNIPPDSISRTIVCSPTALTGTSHCLCSVEPISFYRAAIPSTSRMHISIGFDILMAECIFIRPPTQDNFDLKSEFELLPSLESPCLALLSFDRTAFLQPNFFYIASKLDHQGKGCRFSFHGRILHFIDDLSQLKRFSKKHRSGVVDRVENDRSVICASLFKKETDMTIFEGKEVVLATGERGRIAARFGKSGKVRVELSQALGEKAHSLIKSGQPLIVHLFMKRFADKTLVSYVPDILPTEESS